MTAVTKKEIIAFGILIAFAAGGVALFLSQKEMVVPTENEEPNSIRAISVDHYFENDTHTYKGILTVPTPCHELVSQVTVMESYPEQVTIDLTEQGASNFCAQVITQTPFEVSFKASKDARVSARLNGNPMSLEVTEKSNTKNTTPTVTTTPDAIFDDSFLYEGSGVE